MFVISCAVLLGVLHWEDSNITTLTLNLTLFLGAARIREEDSHSKPCSLSLRSVATRGSLP